jgi:hypothetical protein
LSPLIAALQAEARRWDETYQGWSVEYPASAPVWQAWRERLAGTRVLLEEMALAASSAVAAEPPTDRPLPGPVDPEEEYAD